MRRRYIGLIAAAAILGGLPLTDRLISPEPPARAGRAALSASATPPPSSTARRLANATPEPRPSELPADFVVPATQAGSQNPAAPRDRAEPGDAPAADPTRTVAARPGDTPLKLLMRMGVAPEEAQAAIRKLSTVWDPRDLKAGQKAAILTQSDRLLSLRLALAPSHEVVVARDDSGSFVAEAQERPTNLIPSLGTGTIATSLSEAANRAGVPMSVLEEMIRAFSYDVDFQREVRSGDSFTVLYDRVHDEAGQPTAAGKLAYAEMVLSGTRLRLYQFTPPGGEPGYFTALGDSIKKALLRTPIDGARLTSGFGMRFHPILGYSRMHKGVDFGAAIGTPVFAAGDGVVSRAGPASGYGNYIEIQHNQEWATAYGHLSAFARGLHEGARVHQGEVIGYVGMTGMATGPHLHYEVHDHGVQIDPTSVKMAATTKLEGNELKAFLRARSAIDRELLDFRRDLVAAAECRDPAGRRCVEAQTAIWP